MGKTRDYNTDAAIMRNARAAERERLRNIAIRNNPAATDTELDEAVRQLELEKLSRAGRAGRASQQRAAEVGRRFQEAHPTIEATLTALQINCEDLTRLVTALTIGDTDDGEEAA